MTENNSDTFNLTTPSDREIVIERFFDAPRSLVFEAYSSEEHLKHWWGPKGWELPVCDVDFRPGGIWLYCMKGPAETEFMESWGKAVYQEIVEPERIVYLDRFVDSVGNQIPNTPVMEITVEFKEMNGKTKIISRTLFETAEQLEAVIKMGVEQGIKETFNRLDDYLEKAV